MSEEARKPRKRLGEILVSLGFVTSRQMQEILQKQAQVKHEKGYSRRLGHLLLDEALISEQQLAIGLALQCDTISIDLCGYEVNLASLGRLPPDLVSQFCFVPLGLEDGVLQIALDDMPEPGLEDGLKSALRCPIHFVIAPTGQLSRVRGYAENLLKRGSRELLTRTLFERPFFEGDGTGTDGVRVLGKPKKAEPEDAALEEELGGIVGDALDGFAPAGDELSTEALIAAADAGIAKLVEPPVVELAEPDGPVAGSGPDVTEDTGFEGLAFGATPELEGEDPLDQLLKARPPTNPGLAKPPSSPGIARPPTNPGVPKPPTNPGLSAKAPAKPVEPVSPAPAEPPRRSNEYTQPPLSRINHPLSAPLEAILAELLRSECHSLSLCPHRSDADLVVAHEDGSKVLRTLPMAEYHEVLSSVEQLLGIRARDVTAPLRTKVELESQGTPLTVRVWLMPSKPPTVSFSAVDRESWSSRRRIHLDQPLIDALTRRGAQRHGLVVLTSADAADRDDALSGILAHLKRNRLRSAVFTDRSTHRLREVSYLSVREGSHSFSPEELLFVTESGFDVIAINRPLTGAELQQLVPLAAVEATVLVCLDQKDAVDAVRQLALTAHPPQIVSATLEMVVAVHRARRLCPFCRRPTVLDETVLPPALKATKLAGAVVFQSPGCALCAHQGHRGMVHLYETLHWDHEKAGAAVLALDRKAMQKKCFELGLMRPISLEARNALLQGVVGFDEYLRLIGLGSRSQN